MAEATSTNLNFGHLGTSQYDLDSGEWVFSRVALRRELIQTGPWATVIPPSVKSPSPSLRRTRRSTQQAAGRLARDFPALAPTVEELPELEIVSAAAIDATSTYDATFGNLLSFGTIICEGYKHQPKPVIARATGEVGNILSLQTLGKERRGWEHGSAACLEGPSIARGESAFWNSEATAIRQVCFAQTEERSTSLAARLPSRTIIFRPTYIHRRAPASQSKHYELPSSSIDFRPIHIVKIEDTGGSPHADISFNPEYQRQFGIVDQLGRWSIWNIDDGYRKYNSSVSCARVGNIATATDEPARPSDRRWSHSEGDGWARIVWAGNADTIVVCNRRQIQVFDTKDNSQQLKSPELLTNCSTGWILDVKNLAKNRDQLFVLTTTTLFLLVVTPKNDGQTLEHREAGASILMSWTHFRGTEDFTLQLSLYSTPDDYDESIVLLHSRLNNLVTAYHFNDHPSTLALSFSSSDPITLVLETADAGAYQPQILQLHLEPLDVKGDEHALGLGLADADIDRGVRFYQLSAMLSDLSVRQVILLSRRQVRNRSTMQVNPSLWVRRIRPHRCLGLDLVDDTIEEDDFIEPDGLVVTNFPQIKTLFQPPKLLEREKSQDSWHLLDYRPLYRVLAGNYGSSTTGSETYDMSALISEIEPLLSGELGVPVRTILEIADQSVTASDVDEVSLRLQNLLQSREQHNLFELRQIASNDVLGLDSSQGQEQPTVSSVYDFILQNWIAPLPANTSVRLRQAKERLARRVAAEVVLASMRVRVPEKVQSANEPQPGETESSSQLQSTSLVNPLSPLPSATAVNTVNPLDRLSKHLSIEKKQTTVPPGISKVLMHWKHGVNPSSYDWTTTERILQENLDEEMNVEAVQQKREKARRKRERLEKRQKRENELFRGTAAILPHVLRSSPGPLIGMSSSQAPIQSQSQSQSQSQDLIVQSQVEPGTHGGRPAKKKKGKIRKSGF